MFPLDRWYAAVFSWEFQDKPIARTLLGHPVVLFRVEGKMAALVKPEMTVDGGPDLVRVVRHMRKSQPPPTYMEAWPFTGRIDRWQEIEFRVSHFLIWTGGMDAGTVDLNDPARAGFHMRAFHGITPETESTSYYFRTISSNKNPARPAMTDKIHRATALTFNEDREVIEAQYANWKQFPDASPIGIQADKPVNRARRIIARLTVAS